MKYIILAVIALATRIACNLIPSGTRNLQSGKPTCDTIVCIPEYYCEKGKCHPDCNFFPEECKGGKVCNPETKKCERKQ